jgi:putative transposase
MPRRARYPSDLTEAQWERIRPLLPQTQGIPRGGPRKYHLREVWNAIFYLTRNGCSWRALPHDFPPWGGVWYHFRRWRDDGTLQRVHDALRADVRVAAGKEPTPSAAVLDSQSVKTTERGGPTATTPARGSKGASAFSSSTPSG